MRLNQFVALSSGLSRRAADQAITDKRVKVNNVLANLGQILDDQDSVSLDNNILTLAETKTIALNKPVGYVCSRDGQGSKTVYDLLPAEFHNLKPVGRLDKDSSGLLLLTTDGKLAHSLTHPSSMKEKIYEVQLDRVLASQDKPKIEQGIQLEDGLSQLELSGQGKNWVVRMHQGRNRQIRRTFAVLGYKVVKLHRTQFGPYKLADLAVGRNRQILELT